MGKNNKQFRCSESNSKVDFIRLNHPISQQFSYGAVYKGAMYRSLQFLYTLHGPNKYWLYFPKLSAYWKKIT